MLRFGSVEVWPQQRKLRVGGQDVALGGRAFDLLLALIERRDRVASRSELHDVVWPGRVVEDNNLAVQVLVLRKLLGAQAVATVPGHGYRFTLVIDEDKSPRAVPQQAPAVSGAASVIHPAPLVPPGTPPRMLGRDDELEALHHMLAQHRLVTIVGAGGIGKTTLALAAAHARREARLDGTAWVDLSPISKAALLIPAVAQALQLPVVRRERSLQALIASLKPLQLLFVLDNVEYLADEVARLAAAIAEGAPGVQLLVTSQVPLRVAGERVLRLGPLAVPESGASSDEAMRYGAVALFVDQAQAANPRFSLTDDNVAPAIDLCRHLDGVALAIKLAAARLTFFGLQGLEQRLADRLKVLNGGSCDAPARQQTLRAALDWSYGLLTPPEQAAFRGLGTFAGSFALDAASMVVGREGQSEWTAVEHISALVDRSLVSVESGDPPRYRLLESAREYALAKLDECGETDQLSECHAQAMLEWSERARADSRALADDEIIERHRRDVDNLRAAIDWSAAHEPCLAIDLVGASSFVFSTLNLRHETLRRCEALRPALASHPNSASVARFWFAWASSYSTPNAASRACAWTAAVLYREFGDALELHSALCYVGFSAFVGTEEAEQAMAEAAELERPDWPPRLRALRLFAQGHVHMASGRLVPWRAAHELAAALARSAGAHSISALACGTATRADLLLGEADKALTASRALLAEERTRRGGLLAFALGTYARCLSWHGEATDARVALCEFFGQNRATDWDRIDDFCLAYINFAIAEKRFAAAARLRGYWLGSFVRRGFSRAVTKRFVEQGESTWGPTLQANLDDDTIERLGVEGQVLDAEAVCALTMEIADRPP